MAKKRSTSKATTPGRRYRSPNIPMSVIRRFARAIGERFQPDKVILFGSYAHGTPHEDSDVDILVVMPTRNEIDQSIRILTAFDHLPFSTDLIVRTPKHLERELKDEDWFLREVMATGKILYDRQSLLNIS